MNVAKKILSVIIGSLLLSSSVFAIEAKPTTSTVLVNGKEVKIEAYNIFDNNYFKLRDIAYVLNGTEKQFNVSYDVTTNYISITTGEPYVAIGGEMMQKINESADAAVTNSRLLKDGEEKAVQAYNIDDNNYFRLRDLGEKLDFGVDYDAETNSIVIDTQKSYDTKSAPKQVIMEDVTDSLLLPLGPSPEDLPEPLPDATPEPGPKIPGV